MDKKQYYSQRIGNIKPLNLSDLRVAFKSVFDGFKDRHYFIDLLGKSILSKDGIIGNSFEAFCMRKINRSIYPPSFGTAMYTEEHVFDVIELLYEYINYPVVNPSKDVWTKDEISSNPDKKVIAQQQFRDEINVFLRQYTSGWELSEEGYIRTSLDEGFIEVVDDTAFYMVTS